VRVAHSRSERAGSGMRKTSRESASCQTDNEKARIREGGVAGSRKEVRKGHVAAKNSLDEQPKDDDDPGKRLGRKKRCRSRVGAERAAC